MRQIGSVVATAGGQLGVHVQGSDASGRAHQLGENRRVVAGAAADMDGVLSRLQLEGLDERGQKARLTVVQKALLVDGDQHVVIQVSGIGVGRGPIEAPIGLKDPPWPGAEVALAGDVRERPYHGRRRQMRRGGELLRVTLTGGLDLTHRASPLVLGRPVDVVQHCLHEHRERDTVQDLADTAARRNITLQSGR